jgi:biotin/methionine sulfoxide reductase
MARFAARHPLHLLSEQPHIRLHSQLDHAAYSLDHKVAGREPLRLHPLDAAERGIAEGDVLCVFNDRDTCLVYARFNEGLRRGVVVLAAGAW